VSEFKDTEQYKCTLCNKTHSNYEDATACAYQCSTDRIETIYVEGWVCGKCNKVYPTEDLANKCELSHAAKHKDQTKLQVE